MRIITTLLFLALILASCNTTDTRYAQIKGQFVGDATGKEIHLCKVEHGKTAKVAVTTVGQDGRFGFTTSVEEPGIYVVNIVWDVALRTVKKDHDLARFYLENGTDLEIVLEEGKYELVNSNSEKNNLLSSWNNEIDTMFVYSHGFMYTQLNYTDFFPLLPGFVEMADEFKTTVNSGDASFDELMKLMIDADIRHSALQLLYTPRSKHPEKEDYPEYYDYLLAKGAPKSERLLELANGDRFVSTYAMYNAMSQGVDREKYVEACLDCINNDLLKGYYAITNLSRYRSYDEKYLEFIDMVTPYLLNDYLKETVKAYEITIRTTAEGAKAFDFAGKDVNGKEHKLSDYIGNLVYVDVWATWCGPCKGQIPHLKKLEEKFHGQKITFMSISVDKVKDADKWKKFVKDEALTGLQIMADKAFDSDVTKAYKINAIPRFMLFDKEGNIITTDAPRPSQPDAEKLIKKHL